MINDNIKANFKKMLKSNGLYFGAGLFQRGNSPEPPAECRIYENIMIIKREDAVHPLFFRWLGGRGHISQLLLIFRRCYCILLSYK